MKHSDEDPKKVIDNNHPGLKLAGKGPIVEGILVCVLIVALYLFKRFG